MKRRFVLATASLIAGSACTFSSGLRGLLFVADTNSRDVAVVDARSFKVVGRVALPGKPHGVDLEPGGRRVWASNIRATPCPS